MGSDRVSVSEARTDLRAALVRELAQLDTDVRCAQQRQLVHLAGDLSRIRTRIQTLLTALDRAINSELRREDHAPREAA